MAFHVDVTSPSRASAARSADKALRETTVALGVHSDSGEIGLRQSCLDALAFPEETPLVSCFQGSSTAPSRSRLCHGAARVSKRSRHFGDATLAGCVRDRHSDRERAAFADLAVD